MADHRRTAIVLPPVEQAAERRRHAEQRKHFDQYIKETAGSSQVDELANLAELHDKGKISDAEYEQMKAKLLS